MNLILPIEIKKRELESKLLLALVAVERGFDVLLGERSETNWVAANCVDLEGIIHHKDLAPVAGRTAFLRKVKSNGFINSVQDEESGLLESDYNDFFIKRFNSENIKLADLIFHWGPRDFEHFKTRFPHFRNKMHLTGSPRVDLWKKCFNSYYKESRKKYLLIVSNFATAIGVDSPVKMMIRAGFEEKDNAVEYLKYMLRYQSFQSKTLERLIAFIFGLSDQFNDYDIIIRPHPIDDPAAWRAVFSGFEKIKVIDDGPITPLVRNAHAIIHNGCTTGIEAFVAQLPSYSFCPYGSWHDTEYADQFSLEITNMDQFVQAFSNEENYKKGLADKKEKLKERLFIDPAKLSADMIVEKFVEGYRASSKLPLGSKLNYIKYVNWKKRSTGSAIKLFSSIIGKKIKTDSEFKYPYHSLAEIQTIVDSFSSCLGRFQGVEVLSAGPKSVLLKNG